MNDILVLRCSKKMLMCLFFNHCSNQPCKQVLMKFGTQVKTNTGKNPRGRKISATFINGLNYSNEFKFLHQSFLRVWEVLGRSPKKGKVKMFWRYKHSTTTCQIWANLSLGLVSSDVNIHYSSHHHIHIHTCGKTVWKINQYFGLRVPQTKYFHQ